MLSKCKENSDTPEKILTEMWSCLVHLVKFTQGKHHPAMRRTCQKFVHIHGLKNFADSLMRLHLCLR